jgi:serine protease Do
MVHAGALSGGFCPRRSRSDASSARVIWCSQGYRPFEGLYDVVLTAVTQDQGSEALVSRLSLQAVGYDDAMSIGRRFLEAVQVAK